ncbi:MAG: hypothetical protein FRX49_10601 [Trebouxia sp. A1-2]|nr:MAG: hypothetical protein FRX49_10601 [Trebouxia sp. A1-2]
MADFKEALKDAQIAGVFEFAPAQTCLFLVNISVNVTSDLGVSVGLDPRWQKGWYRLASALEGLGMLPEAEIAVDTGLPLDASNTEMQQLLKQVRRKSKGSPPADEQSSEDRQLQQDIHTFFRKHCKNATLLKERGANNNVPSAEDDLYQSMPAKQAVQQAPTPLTKQQKKKRRQQKKAAQSSASPSQSPEREPVPSPDPNSERVTQSSAAQDQSMPQAPPEATTTAATDSPHAPSPPTPQGPPTTEQQAESAKDLGNTQYKAGQYDAALLSYGKAIALCPEVAAYYGNRAAAALMKRQYKLAVQDSLQATKLSSAFARGYQRAGKAYLCMGQLDEADSQYKRALELEPSSVAIKGEAQLVDMIRSNLKLGQECLQAGDARQAQWHADKAVRLHSPAVETALLLKCEALIALGKSAEALNETRSLTIQGDPMATEVLTVRAQALYLTGNMSLAENTYQVVLRLDPDNASSRKGLKRIKLMNNSKNAGNEAFKAGKWREAEQHYTQALELDSHLKSSFVAQCACNRAAAHLKLGNAEAALKDAEVATELDPQYARAYVRRAAAHQALEHFEEAVRDYEKVKSLEESTAGIDGMIRDAKTALKKSKRVDYYKLLELDQNAGDADLKRAYRKAALRYHPDKASKRKRQEMRNEEECSKLEGR